jgi:hypothetical protein
MFDQDYVVGWGTLALVNAALAQAQRRSGLRWFITSLFLGPVATLLMVLWYRTPQLEDAGAGSTADRRAPAA